MAIHETRPPGDAVFANDIATAPGDLPMPAIGARFSARLTQFRHDNTIEPLAPRPDEPVQVWATSGTEMPVAEATVFYTTDGSLPDERSARLAMEAARVDWDPQAGYLTYWRVELPGFAAGTGVRYRIAGRLAGTSGDGRVWAHDGQGFWFKFPGLAGITTFAYMVEEPAPPMPSWMDSAVIYHVFLDRYHPGTPDGAWHGEHGIRTRHGGNLRGVRASLPYLVELGITCLWLSPLHPAETYHRYDGIDFFEVDSDLGTVEELTELVAECHRLGIRVWLDYVPSHCSWRHPAFQMAQSAQDTPTYPWFTFNRWPDDYRSFLQVAKYLPSFDTSDPGARQYLLDAARFWLREVGIDGFRLDHAIAPSFDFWVAFRAATEAVNPEVVNVGEATDTPDCLRRYRGHLHGVLDFPLARALRLTFGTGAWSVAKLDSFLASYERFMADGPGRVSFLDNHDMDRFLWLAGNDVDRLKSAALCQFTLAATPVVYYGTEIGATQTAGKDQPGSGGDAQARGDMPWDRAQWNEDLLAFYRALIALRRDHAALQHGARVLVHLDAAAGTYGYLRTPGDGREPMGGDVAVFFNLSDTERTVPALAGSWQRAIRTSDGCREEPERCVLPPHSGIALIARSE
jgi:cyclomaltodextrinase / maltogenic alpha-amylase / neopullulanase